MLGAMMAAALVVMATAARAGGGVRNNSYAQPDDVVMTHLALDLTVDFESEVLRGTARIEVENRTGAGRLHLDTRNLAIEDVRLEPGNTAAHYELGEAQETLGQDLSIDINASTKAVVINYATTDAAVGVDWLKPSQTAGGVHPFLYTQGESILSRTWFPCQDTPEVRFTYEATIRVPAGLMAVMSAENPQERRPDGVYHFAMPQAIPAYLVALAVGDIDFRAVSPRCGVYAEPTVVEAAAWEFADTEKMMQAAEALYGPYRWDRYDILVLPPSFPYGGMENPRLTFVTPVLVAGDRSLVATIAHELAHSWSGNLVTNATWDDFWLNEGFTVYFERRILEAVYGRDRSEMEAVLGFADLEEELGELGADNPDTRLHVDTEGRNPDDAEMIAQYEKGYLFLRNIEESVGREAWDSFLRGYFDEFAFQSMTTERFLAYLRENLLNRYAGIEGRLDIDAWVYQPGLPERRPVARSDALDRVERQITRWRDGVPAGELDTDGWNSQQWKHFVQHLPHEMTHEQMAELDAAFHFTDKANAEVTQQWLLAAIDNAYRPAYPRIESFLVGTGRIWLIRPLYMRLAESEAGRAMAEYIYAKARPGYHPLTVAAVDRVLGDGEVGGR